MSKLDVKILVGEIGGLIGILIGDVDGLIIALIIFAIIDYITGVTAAIFAKQLNSEVGFKGITKKVLLFAIVAVANILDQYVIGSGAICRSATILFYLANEGLSILENVSEIGIPIPEKLKTILDQLKEEDK